MELNEQVVIATIIALVIGFLLGRGSQSSNRSLELKIDYLLKHLGVEVDLLSLVPENIAKEVAAGNTIKAIKMYRIHAGCGLKEAKEMIDKVMSKQAKDG